MVFHTRVADGQSGQHSVGGGLVQNSVGLLVQGWKKQEDVGWEETSRGCRTMPACRSGGEKEWMLLLTD